MAKPDTENGYTKIANELLEAICRTKITNYEYRVFMMIIRKTYGFNKKFDWIAQKQIVEKTGICKSHISRTIKNLLKKNMIIRKGKKIGIQKDYDQWKLSTKLPNQVTIIKKEKLPNQVTEVTQPGNKKLSHQVSTKEKKETIQKKDFFIILDYWNKKDLIPQKRMTPKLRVSINAALKDNSIDEIKNSIHCYSAIQGDHETYWWNYEYTLIDFMESGFYKFKDVDIAYENYRRKDKE